MAMAPRGATLTSFVRSNIPELGVTPGAAVAPPGAKTTPVAQASRCGCDVVGLPGESAAALSGIGVLFALVRRRFSRRPKRQE